MIILLKPDFPLRKTLNKQLYNGNINRSYKSECVWYLLPTTIIL